MDEYAEVRPSMGDQMGIMDEMFNDPFVPSPHDLQEPVLPTPDFKDPSTYNVLKSKVSTREIKGEKEFREHEIKKQLKRLAPGSVMDSVYSNKGTMKEEVIEMDGPQGKVTVVKTTWKPRGKK